MCFLLQCSLPSHPNGLEYNLVDFMDYNWKTTSYYIRKRILAIYKLKTSTIKAIILINKICLMYLTCYLSTITYTKWNRWSVKSISICFEDWDRWLWDNIDMNTRIICHTSKLNSMAVVCKIWTEEYIRSPFCGIFITCIPHTIWNMCVKFMRVQRCK